MKNLTKLQEYVEYYLQEYRKNENVIFPIRLNSETDAYSIMNPTIQPKNRKDYSLKPKLMSNIFQEDNYYLTLDGNQDLGIGLFFKKSKYRKNKYDDLRQPLFFDLVNEIELFHINKRHKKFPKWPQYEIQIENFKRTKYRDLYVLEEERKSRKRIFYAFDLPWDEALIVKRLKVPPDLLFFYCSALSNDESSLKLNLIRLQDLILTRLNEHVDTSVLNFLMQREVPTIASIWKKTVIDNRELDDESLDKLNMFAVLNKIALTNALNLFLFRLCFGFILDLITNKKLLVCRHCNQIIRRHRQDQEYCTMKYEGRDCSKRARNKKYYNEHREELQLYYRHEMRQTRDLMNNLKHKENTESD